MSTSARTQYYLFIIYFTINAVLCQTEHQMYQPHKQTYWIAGGVSSNIYNFPYCVSIVTTTGMCGGSIISSDIVISAKHCFVSLSLPTPRENEIFVQNIQHIRIRVGSDHKGIGGYVVKVEQGILHPVHMKDIALLKLKNKLIFDRVVSPVPLIEANAIIMDGTLATIAGWGDTSKSSGSDLLRDITLPIISHETCAKIIKNLLPFNICVGDLEGDRGACKGDSGSGMTIDGKLAGIVSRGIGCVKKGTPSIMIDLRSTVPWIISTIDSMDGEPILITTKDSYSHMIFDTYTSTGSTYDYIHPSNYYDSGPFNDFIMRKE